MYLRKMRCLLTEEEYQTELRKRLEDTRDETTKDAEDWGNNHQEFMRCRAGRSSFWISWDGTMTACGLTPFPLQVYPFERPFRDCWLELTERVRSTPVLQECTGCSRRSECNPCVAMLYAETGDVSRRAPYLCEMAESILDNMKHEVEERSQYGQRA